ncbi:BamA/TamA family outer membrane protein [Xanthocytophaga agilis]|uniref:BamA/TamA family outer membrane protein n=1 Tax=Xanthocytophaga agilis TaxID=3048010 RepID=A0AAE3UCP1_9BACT|nr:BamA/TamA family outer membrane protein [Xanthocytophaga agilis]MDJ1500295.1 BamA/TamA family outer membrane protein [Xanthocytophaga agilis]
MKKGKRCIFLLLVFLLSLGNKIAYTQPHQKPGFISRYWNKLVNDTSANAKSQFLVYPTLAYAPETSWEFGLSSLYVFYAKGDTNNRLSEINGFTFLTLKRQYGFWFDHALYSHENKWFSLGRLRLQSFPLLYHGIGPDSPEEHLAQVNANLLQIRERVLRKIYPSLYFGLEVDYQRLSSVEFELNTDEPIDHPPGSTGSANLGVGLGILYDNRHNVLNVRKGFFSELSLLNYDKNRGSDFSFTSVISDTRIYRPINKRDVLAAQVFGQFNFGNPPFNQLSLLGGESIMRGYYLGRFRDNNQIAAQVEYRFLPLPLGFTKRVGAAVFAGSGTVFNSVRTLQFHDFVWSAGAGLRFLIFPKKDIFTRLDVAFTQEGPGFYIFIGEAF